MPWFSCDELTYRHASSPLFCSGYTCSATQATGILVDLEDEVVAQALLDHRPGALHQLVGLDGLLGQQLNGPHVLLLGGPDLLVLVRVNQRADAVVGEHLGQQAFVQRAVDDVDARHAGVAGGGGVLRLGEHLRRETRAVLLHELVQLRHEHLPDQLARGRSSRPAS